MSAKVKMVKPVLAELSIEVPHSDVKAAMDRAYGLLSRTANVRGFRRGKAPRAVLRRTYGKALRADVKNELINTHLLEALIEHTLDPISPPAIEAGELDENADFGFKVTFEVRPRVDAVQYEGIEVERNKVTVSEKDVAHELERLRAAMASVKELSEARPAAKGDVATISLKQWLDGKWEESDMPEQEIVIGEDQAPEKLDEALVGMNVGEETIVDMGSETELEENRLRYMVTLTALKERNLPNLDDELAKDTGDYDTLDELRDGVKKRITEARENAEEQRLRLKVFDALREKNPMELPPSIVERHTAAMKQQFFGQMHFPEEQTDEQKERFQKLEEGTEKTARDMVHQHLLMAEIARIENIKVDEAEVDAEIEKSAELSGVPVPMLRAQLGKDGAMEELSSRLLEKKIFAHVKSVITVSEVDAAEGERKSPSNETATEKKTAKKSDTKKTPTQKAATKKTTETKTAAKKTAAKKTATKKTETQKTAAKKTAAKKTAAKKTATKKTAAKKS